MDSIVNQIMAFSRKSAFEDLARYLDANLETIKKCSPQVVPAIQALLPEANRHTMGLVYLLYVRGLVPDRGILELSEAIFADPDPNQIRNLCVERFGAVVHRYAEVVRNLKQYAVGIRVLMPLVLKFRPNIESITPIHPDIIMLCLLEKNYSAAKRLLDDTILEICPHATGVTPRDYLLYYYYGGMVWIGLKQWDKAYEFLQTCITAPCVVTLNAIMVEAFKKFVLVCLISKGKFSGIPRQASGVVQRSMKKMCQEYVDLANAYCKREPDKLLKVVSDHRSVFAADRHMGLLGQVQQAYTRQAIQRLTATYVTLSLDDIIRAVGVESAAKVESLLLDMTERGELRASIDRGQGMVSFVDADAEIDVLEADLANVRRTIERLKAMEESVMVSPEYQLKLMYKDPKARAEIIDLEERTRKSRSLLNKMQDYMQ